MGASWIDKLSGFVGLHTTPIVGSDEYAAAGEELRRTTNTLTRFAIVGFCAIGAVAVAAGIAAQGVRAGWVAWLEAMAGGYLLAAAAAMLGGLLGFLFGIPRALQGEDGKSTLVNTNLEQISDWLTKILVGVSLTQLTSLPDRLWVASDKVKGIFGTLEGQSIAAAVIVAFAILGFFAGYLCTRLFLTIALLRADRLAQPAKQEVARGEGFVSEVNQVDQLLEGIEKLSDDAALQLIANPPTSDSSVTAMIGKEDPDGERLRDASKARKALARYLVMGERSTDDLAAWRKAVS